MCTGEEGSAPHFFDYHRLLTRKRCWQRTASSALIIQGLSVSKRPLGRQRREKWCVKCPFTVLFLQTSETRGAQFRFKNIHRLMTALNEVSYPKEDMSLKYCWFCTHPSCQSPIDSVFNQSQNSITSELPLSCDETTGKKCCQLPVT